jgi:methionine-rich copper-binding protein CopC
MVVTPAGIIHLTDLDSSPRTFELHVGNMGPGQFTWAATVAPEVDWLDVRSMSGTSGQDIKVEIAANDLKPGTYEASIRIVSDDPDVQNGDQTIPLTLRVRKQLHSTYLPAIHRSDP